MDRQVIAEMIKEMKNMKLPLRRSNLGRLSALALVGLMALTACGGSSSKPPEIKITAPESGAALNVGQSVAIVGTATGDAISRVDVIIDGQTYATLNAPDKSKGVPSFPINVPWTPLSAGTHAIQMKAFGPPDDKLLTQSEPLVLNAQAASVPATPTAEAQPTTAVAPTTAPATTPAAGDAQTVPTVAPPAATTAPAAGNANNSAPSLTVTNDFVNVRTGPDTAYDKVGELKQNQTAPVKGKSADGQWWQISFPSGQGGVGWVIRDYVQANAAANNVPVASAPLKPVVAQQPAAPAAPAQPPVLVPLVTVAPPQVQPVAPGPLTGGANVLKVEANPVSAGGTAWAYWNIPNFKEGCFDRGDGAGCKGPIAQTMRVDVPGVSGPRTITLKWTDANGAAQQDTLALNSSGTAPVASGGGALAGGANVLRLEANPVASGTTAWAFWNIPNFKEGCFDKADGAGCKGPIAQAMRVDVPNVTGPRTLLLKWTDTNGAAQQDTLTLNVAGVVSAPVVNTECNPNNPDWQASKNGNPDSWTFCKRKDLEWVGDAPGLNIDRNDRTLTMAWNVYGVKGVYLVFEPNSSQGPAGSTQRSIPTTGTGPQSFRANEFEPGCYRITLRLDTNAGNRTDFGEKILCIGVGGGGNPAPNPNPQPQPQPQPPSGGGATPLP